MKHIIYCSYCRGIELNKLHRFLIDLFNLLCSWMIAHLYCFFSSAPRIVMIEFFPIFSERIYLLGFYNLELNDHNL